jgi:carboxylate-amine ligase
VQTRSVGVEEELLLVDPHDGQALSVASAALEQARHGESQSSEGLIGELTRQQLETATRPCVSLEEL